MSSSTSAWRTSAESVVKACEQSCKNLGVESIDLYQVSTSQKMRGRIDVLPSPFMPPGSVSSSSDKILVSVVVLFCFSDSHA